jgi:2-polyprenyl-6-methoxyphenol hydroxylase-like FAD-dependent oxidoreductase
MTRTRVVEALVVGAGPVGLFAALALAERGVVVDVIDENPKLSSSSEPITLGPRALELLDSLDLLPALEAAGRRVERVIVHDGDRAPRTLELSKLQASQPFLLVTQRSVLLEALAGELEQQGGEIRWGHRLRALHPAGILRASRAEIDELEPVSAGYAVQTIEAVVKRQSEASARLVVGADGRESMVRRALEIDFPAASDPEILAAYDFDEDDGAQAALHLVLHADGVDVVCPRPGGGSRHWALVPQRDAGEVVFESHLDLSLEPLQFGEVDPASFERSVIRRAPWMSRTDAPSSARAVRYQRRCAEHFGHGLVWLGGDAAHLAGPLASQSENVGLDEASDLAERGAAVLRHGAGRASFATFESMHRSELDALCGRAPEGSREERMGWLAASMPIFGEQRAVLFADLA